MTLESLLAAGWALAGCTAPSVCTIGEDALPDGVRRLMAGDGGMTAALGRRWGTPVGLRLLGRHVVEHVLLRLVVLERPDDRSAIEVAAIRIDLDAIGPRAGLRALIGDVPFGTVLAETGVSFRSTAQSYGRISADAALAQWAGIAEGTALYGRLAELRRTDGRILAEAAEILPRW